MGTAANREYVVLVNEQDQAIGTMEKMVAHRSGMLHRAFSIFLFDPEGRVLLQQRADAKYHSAGLWSNACCSHPRPGEDVLSAAVRRLGEELGAEAGLEKRFAFTYHAHFANHLQEHEFDHVLFGAFSGVLHPDPEEIKAVRWLSPEELSAELATMPEAFTPWLRICWPKVLEHIQHQPVSP